MPAAPVVQSIPVFPVPPELSTTVITTPSVSTPAAIGVLSQTSAISRQDLPVVCSGNASLLLEGSVQASSTPSVVVAQTQSNVVTLSLIHI